MLINELVIRGGAKAPPYVLLCAGDPGENTEELEYHSVDFVDELEEHKLCE